VFAALINIYSRFDSKTLRAVTDRDDKGKQYIKDVIEEEKDIRQGYKLSKSFGSILGDIGLCITYFEEGRAVSFKRLLDRYESETIEIDPNLVAK